MALMRKDPEVTNPGRPAASGIIDTILGPGASFEGKLTFQGEVRIDGRFSGEIHSEDKVVISKDAEVEAQIHVGSLELHGTLRGNVKASKLVELYPPAKLYGNIETPSLTIPKPGVVFEGNCKMEGLGKGRSEGPKLVKKDGDGDGKKD